MPDRLKLWITTIGPPTCPIPSRRPARHIELSTGTAALRPTEYARGKRLVRNHLQIQRTRLPKSRWPSFPVSSQFHVRSGYRMKQAR